ncbi:SDR family NAD(P)-dependent oxidoreductase [Leifsonia sp. Leaf264]|uniref:SDR family NAD(P)-dependent oxidoreductase n=1 Tax=Leifsonia sp. Leaf264 TaxID=1736314 RepID=UPI0009E792B6|nr:SDR family oxidoreductase [Leifsonia sp. Leaf264]
MARQHFDPMGSTAVITGASSGLGVAFAHEFARRGADLVLVARRQERLEALAVDLAERYGAESTVIPMDLTRQGAVDELVGDIERRGIRVGSLVNNAGFASYGRFGEIDGDRMHQEVELNVAALTMLSRGLWGALTAHCRTSPGNGALVNVASTVAFQPVPFMGVYAASKAYVLSLTEALWYEAKGTGLKVTALCPGPTATEFTEVAGNGELFFKNPQTAEQVIDTAFRALDARSTPPSIVSGAGNAAGASLVGLVPKRSLLTALGRATTPGRRR